MRTAVLYGKEDIRIEDRPVPEPGPGQMLVKNMSQAKVDRYKEEKKNRKQTIKKEKRNRVLGRTLGVVIAAAIVCWIGFSGYSYYQEKKPMTKTELSMTALNEYMSNLSSTDSATE